MFTTLLLLATGLTAMLNSSVQSPQLQRTPTSTKTEVESVVTQAASESSVEGADPKVLTYLSPDPFYSKSINQIPAQNNKLSVMTRYSGPLLTRFQGNEAKEIILAVAQEATRVRAFILNDEGETIFEEEITDLEDIPGCDVWGVGYLWGHEIHIDVDFDIPEDPFILGYEIEIANTGTVNSIPVIIQEVPTQNVCFVDQHIGYGIQPYYGAAYMEIRTEGEGGLLEYDASLTQVYPVRVAVEQDFNEGGQFVNLGTKPISSILFDYTYPDGTKQTYLLESEDEFGYMSSITFALPMVGNSVSSSVRCPITISRLNDNEDSYPADNTLYASIISMSAEDAPERTVVVEMATGTWCGYCPRSIASIDYLPEYTNTKHIPIEIHVQDEFEGKNIDGYKPYVNSAPGIPYAWVNRNISCDPWQGLGTDALAYGFGEVVDYAGSCLVELSVNVDAVYDAEAGTITLKSTTTPAIDLNESDRYKVGFALLENGLKGFQTNYYSHGAEYPYPQEYVPEPMMSWWEAEPIVLWEYKYTLRSVSDANGSEFLGDGLISAGSTIDSSYTFDASDVTDYTQSIAVAFVFDTLAGEIVNAAQSDIKNGLTVKAINDKKTTYSINSGILSIENAADVNVYDMYGRKVLSKNASTSLDLNSLSEGIYVIDMNSNGNHSTIKTKL